MSKNLYKFIGKFTVFLFVLVAFSFFYSPSVQAVGDVCQDDATCCTPPQSVIDGGGCPAGKYWIGPALGGKCTTSATTCANPQKFSCSTGGCTALPPAPSICNSGEVHVGSGVCWDPIHIIREKITASSFGTIYKAFKGGYLGTMVYLPEGTTCAANEVIGWDGSKWGCARGGLWTPSPTVTDAIYYDTGKVGIGTTAPTDDLHVVGTSKFATTAGDLSITTPGGSGPGLVMYAPNGHRRDIRATNGGLRLAVSSGPGSPSSDRGLSVDGPTGNVGVGTNNPTSKLSVGGGGIANTAIYGKGGIGVYGEDNDGNKGYLGYSWRGVYGEGLTIGVEGKYNGSNYGQLGLNGYGAAVYGSWYGISAEAGGLNPTTGTGVKAKGGDYGGYFDGGEIGVWAGGIDYGVKGYSTGGTGVYGEGPWIGVHGKSNVWGIIGEGPITGVIGKSTIGTGVYGEVQAGSSLYGVHGNHLGGGYAGYFDGKAYFSGDVGIGSTTKPVTSSGSNFKLWVTGPAYFVGTMETNGTAWVKDAVNVTHGGASFNGTVSTTGNIVADNNTRGSCGWTGFGDYPSCPSNRFVANVDVRPSDSYVDLYCCEL